MRSETAGSATASDLPAPSASAPLGQACPDTGLQPSSGNLDRVRAATLCLVNQERAARGLGALEEESHLESAAGAHVNDMLARNYWGHESPDGSTPLSRIQDSGYLPADRAYMVGENLAYGAGDASPASIVAAWMASPGHRENILTAEYRESGIVVAAAVPRFASVPGLTGGLYAQEFGVHG